MFCIMFAQSFELITMSLSTDPLLGADDASGLSWQLVTTICDEADGLTLCVSDSHKVATNIFEKRDGKWLLCCHHASHTKR
jgi:hypothetical protein